MGLKQKYELNSFQFTGSNQEDEDGASLVVRSTQDALISTSYKNSLMHSALKACDALNGVLVPRLLNANGATPADRWNFLVRHHVLLEHSKVTKEQVLLTVVSAVQ